MSRARGFQGSVTGVPLVELLQMFNHTRRTVALVLNGTTTGRIDFERGEVVHAETGSLAGIEAFRFLLNAPGGTFSAARRSSDVRTIDMPLNQLLMQALRNTDPDDAGEISGLDSFRSWCPAPAENQITGPIPLPPALPRYDDGIDFPDSKALALRRRWESVEALIGRDARRGLVVAIDRRNRSRESIEGQLVDGLLDEALRVVEALESRSHGVEPGVFESTSRGVAIAVLWRDDGVLFLAANLDGEGAAWFRARTALIARHVFASGTEQPEVAS